MKNYTVKQYSKEEWESKFEADYAADNFETEYNEISIVWEGNVARLDIMAEGKRIVPILRKIEKALTENGLSGENGVFGGWFDQWADALVNPFDKKYFIWNYDGRQDAENGHYSYSWGIESTSEDTWYIFLNIATASECGEYIREKIAEKAQQTADEKAVENMVFETMENIDGDLAKIYFLPADAEKADNFPVLWEIEYADDLPHERRIHHDTYNKALGHLERCGYIW